MGLGLFAIAAGLVWHGAGMVAARMNRIEPSRPVSFAESGRTAHDLLAANHAAATMGGSFVARAIIGTSNVQGVPVWMDRETVRSP